MSAASSLSDGSAGGGGGGANASAFSGVAIPPSRMSHNNNSSASSLSDYNYNNADQYPQSYSSYNSDSADSQHASSTGQQQQFQSPNSNSNQFAPNAQAVNPNSNQHLTLDPTISHQQWYFYDITREQVARLMQGKPDGTFLVRDSQDDAGYTLTLRCNGGTNKLIKIYYSPTTGRFGFSEPFEFLTVRDLIQHHYTQSLVRYNRNLDICLKYPLSRKTEFDSKSTEDAIALLKAINIDYIVTSDMYDKCYEEHEQLKQQLQVKRQALDAFDLTIQMYEEQLAMARNITSTVATSTPPNNSAECATALKRNEDVLIRKIRGMQNSKQTTLEQVRQEQVQQHNKAMDMRSMEPRIMRLYKQREDLSKVLHQQRNMHIDTINMHLQDSSRQAQIETAKQFGGASASSGSSSAPAAEQKPAANNAEQPPEQPQNDFVAGQRDDPNQAHVLQHQISNNFSHARSRSNTSSYNSHLQPTHNTPTGVTIPVVVGKVHDAGSLTQLSQPHRSTLSSPVEADFFRHAADRHPFHAQAENWYFGGTQQLELSRQHANSLLSGKVPGTFLIRQRRVSEKEPPNGTHALSIVVPPADAIQHAIIYENPTAGTFSFVQPSAVAHSAKLVQFCSLNELVLFYAETSLEEHNPQLKIPLLHPVKQQQPLANDVPPHHHHHHAVDLARKLQHQHSGITAETRKPATDTVTFATQISTSSYNSFASATHSNSNSNHAIRDVTRAEPAADDDHLLLIFGKPSGMNDDKSATQVMLEVNSAAVEAELSEISGSEPDLCDSKKSRRAGPTVLSASSSSSSSSSSGGDGPLPADNIRRHLAAEVSGGVVGGDAVHHTASMQAAHSGDSVIKGAVMIHNKPKKINEDFSTAASSSSSPTPSATASTACLSSSSSSTVVNAAPPAQNKK